MKKKIILIFLAIGVLGGLGGLGYRYKKNKEALEACNSLVKVFSKDIKKLEEVKSSTQSTYLPDNLNNEEFIKYLDIVIDNYSKSSNILKEITKDKKVTKIEEMSFKVIAGFYIETAKELQNIMELRTKAVRKASEKMLREL